jgi:hypothetical protein
VVRRPPRFPSLRLEGWRFQVWVGGGGNAGAEKGNWQVVCSVHLSELREAAQEGGLMLLAADLFFCVRAPHWRHLSIPGWHGLAVDGEVLRLRRRPDRGNGNSAVFLGTAAVKSICSKERANLERRSVLRESLPRPTQESLQLGSDDENKRTCCCFGCLCVSVAWASPEKKDPRPGRQSPGQPQEVKDAVATVLAGGDTRSRQSVTPLR